MATALFSPSWYRVASLHPRLRKHIEVHRHDYRGRVWHILQDHANGRSHRVSPAAYHLLGLMDGKRTMQKLWDLACEQLGARAPTQDEAIRLLGQLHAADAMICDVSPDSRELFRRFQKHERQKIKQKVWSPLAVRLPLWDPNRFLDRTYPYVSGLFTTWGMIAWVLLAITGTVLAITHFDQITENIYDRALSIENLFVLWLVYPVVKAFHELGHGYAIKANGGEVHEIGIMFLVLIPVPYVEASAASGFRDKYQRMLVGGIGIMVEMGLATLALMIWLNVEPGPTHVVAYNVMLIGGISTLLFNGNPLLRFDGYYVLADWAEIPNLGSRSNNHIFYVLQKYVFASKDVEPVTSLAAERWWFVLYGVLAFIYRMFIMFAIILYIGGKFLALGVLLAIWAIFTQAVVPIAKGVQHLFSSPKLRANRPRAFLMTGGALAIIGAVLFVMPFPHISRLEGVTWPSDRSQIRIESDGFVAELPVQSRTDVQAGDPIVISDEPLLQARAQLIRAQIHSLEVQEAATRFSDRIEAALTREEISAARVNLERVEEQIASLTVRAPRDGKIVIPGYGDLIGQFVRQGGLVGYVVDKDDTLSIRIMVDQDQVGFVREDVEEIEIIPEGYGQDPIPAVIIRETPGGTIRLPTPALGVQGGGEIPVDPRDGDGIRTLERYFEFELRVPDGSGTDFLGRRVQVKIDHGWEPMGFQIWRALRQLFLRLYGV